MRVIPQRELRNQVSSVLRRAEQGERFTVTVDGRPVAQLGPLPDRKEPAAADRLAAVIGAAPVDAEWVSDLRAMRDADATHGHSPWAS